MSAALRLGRVSVQTVEQGFRLGIGRAFSVGKCAFNTRYYLKFELVEGAVVDSVKLET